MSGLKCFCADLHIHTALSPCTSDEMTPQNIVRMAKLNHIEIIGITDHNSAENVAAVIQAGEAYGVYVLPGMEVQSREEVHLLCFFQEIGQMLEWQAFIYSYLPPLLNNEKFFGRQLLFDYQDNLCGTNERLLINSVNLSIGEIVHQVNRRGGLCIPAHVDRVSHGLLGHLGFIPDDVAFCGLEISKNTTPQKVYAENPSLKNYTLFVSSDAHGLEDMCQNRTFFRIQEPTLKEIVYALKNQFGRSVSVL